MINWDLYNLKDSISYNVQQIPYNFTYWPNYNGIEYLFYGCKNLKQKN